MFICTRVLAKYWLLHDLEYCQTFYNEILHLQYFLIIGYPMGKKIVNLYPEATTQAISSVCRFISLEFSFRKKMICCKYTLFAAVLLVKVYDVQPGLNLACYGQQLCCSGELGKCFFDIASENWNIKTMLETDISLSTKTFDSYGFCLVIAILKLSLKHQSSWPNHLLILLNLIEFLSFRRKSQHLQAKFFW